MAQSPHWWPCDNPLEAETKYQGTEIAMGIQTHKLIKEGPLVGHTATAPFYVQLAGIAKTNGANAPYCLVNEVVCAELGRMLGLPLPPSTLIDLPASPPKRPAAQKAFASLDFNLQGVRLPPVNPDECVRLLPDLSAGVVLFDVLILNTDRHRGNLSLDTTNQARLTVFDHSHALLGNTPSGGVQRLTDGADILGVNRVPFGGNHQCLLAALKDDRHFDKWLCRIEAIPEFVIDDLVGAAKDLGCSTAEGDSLGAFLKVRRSNIRRIIQNNQAAFSGIAQWSLFNAC